MKVNRRQWLGRIAAGGAGALLPFPRAAADSPVAAGEAGAAAAKASRLSARPRGLPAAQHAARARSTRSRGPPSP